MSVPLLGHNYLEFLDEKIARGIDVWPSSERPPLTADERRVLKSVAEGLCFSAMSIEWAYYLGTQGNDKGYKRLRERMLSKPVKLVVK